MPSSRPFAVSRCAECGLSAWPPPAMCRRCGSLGFAPEPAPGGTLEEATGSLGTVRTDAGPMVVARVAGAQPGAAVTLRVVDGALEAT
jgi:hypothetical protein